MSDLDDSVSNCVFELQGAAVQWIASDKNGIPRSARGASLSQSPFTIAIQITVIIITIIVIISITIVIIIIIMFVISMFVIIIIVIISSSILLSLVNNYYYYYYYYYFSLNPGQDLAGRPCDKLEGTSCVSCRPSTSMFSGLDVVDCTVTPSLAERFQCTQGAPLGGKH